MPKPPRGAPQQRALKNLRLIVQHGDAKPGVGLPEPRPQHRAILDAIRTREGGRAEAQAREHAYLAQQNLCAVLGAKDRLHDTVPGLALVTDLQQT